MDFVEVRGRGTHASQRRTNEVIGIYVSAGSRNHLYRYLDRLQENAIYCYTDIVIYIQPRDGLALIETGDKLGDMTSELHPSENISEFVSGGPNKSRTGCSILQTGCSRKPSVKLGAKP